jgi:putative molybdopterin biosynthesis protein
MRNTLRAQGIHLQYNFEAMGQGGSDIQNPLFDLLCALEQQGSIRQAALQLGQSYRHVWGSLKHWEEVLGQELVAWSQGKRAEITPFARRLVWAERQARTRLRPHIEALRAELLHVLAQAGNERIECLEVAASHCLALPALQALASREELRLDLHLGLRFTGSAEALRSLNEGQCQVAGFHVVKLQQASKVFTQALQPLLKPGVHKLLGSHSRTQGLMLRRGPNPPTSLAAVARRGLRFVARQSGSGTQLLLQHLLASERLQADALQGDGLGVEHTHVAVAARIASGAADVGLGVAAAASEFGLHFVPMAEEEYYFVCLKPALETPALQRLRELLASAHWRLALAQLPGYGAHRSGEVLSLTRALPWWHEFGS